VGESVYKVIERVGTEAKSWHVIKMEYAASAVGLKDDRQATCAITVGINGSQDHQEAKAMPLLFVEFC
jgi:hypothetical protein